MAFGTENNIMSNNLQTKMKAHMNDCMQHNQKKTTNKQTEENNQWMPAKAESERLADSNWISQMTI